VIQRFQREPVPGYVNMQEWLTETGIEIITPGGTHGVVPYGEAKVVCFVKDFGGVDWRGERRRFIARPKTEGLWVLALFRDDDLLEAVMPNNLLGDERQGYLVVPPDASSNNQRLFLPRDALKELKVLGVIGTPPRTRKPVRTPGEGQIRLFDP
jgi:hypothetical protein